MIKHELFRNTDQSKRGVPVRSMSPLPLRPLMSHTTSEIIPQRSIDPRAIDISSIKGRFAWEKIAHGDTYIPIIFRYVNIFLLHQTFSKECKHKKEYSIKRIEIIKYIVRLYNHFARDFIFIFEYCAINYELNT